MKSRMQKQQYRKCTNNEWKVPSEERTDECMVVVEMVVVVLKSEVVKKKRFKTLERASLSLTRSHSKGTDNDNSP